MSAPTTTELQNIDNGNRTHTESERKREKAGQNENYWALARSLSLLNIVYFL